MRFITHLLFVIFSNTLALVAAAYFIPGFSLSGNAKEILIVGLILTGMNLILRPILRLFFGPLLILSFGLFALIINVLTLIILDFFSPTLTIQGYLPLIYGTGIITLVNLVLSFVGKLFTPKE